MPPADTIVAVATAGGSAGIGVVRLSGPAVRDIAAAICSAPLVPRRAILADFLSADRSAIDRGIALLFNAPHSYTGEDVLELQGHGGTAVLRLLVQRCVELGARPAGPGEFTQRAFLNDKLDLVQAESVADLIDASSAAAARSAMQTLSGAFSAHVNAIAAGLLEIRMLVEALLDFPEEETDTLQGGTVAGRIREMGGRIEGLLAEAGQGRLLRDGTRAVLIGRPNVGKSSLMNRLAGEDVSIVTDIPGTTRDALRYQLNIEGVPIHVVDTAGLRQGGDAVERLGIERTLMEISRADIALLVVDSRDPDALGPLPMLSALPSDIKILRVINKIDLSGDAAQRFGRDGEVVIRVSAKTGEGIDLLAYAILELAGWQSAGEAPFMARERHTVALRECAEALQRAQQLTAQAELMAEELRLAHRALGRITGEVSADDLLGEIFSRFCIGK
jgi:tRNA modification GTPase